MFNIMHHAQYSVKRQKWFATRGQEVLEFSQPMTAKDERIGFRVSSEIKVALSQIAKKEGRSLAQVCELLLKGGIHEYEREGTRYLHRFVGKSKEKGK
jgi:hypothetical protein